MTNILSEKVELSVTHDMMLPGTIREQSQIDVGCALRFPMISFPSPGNEIKGREAQPHTTAFSPQSDEKWAGTMAIGLAPRLS